MAQKIFLSPSNQTDNYYAAGSTTEAVQCGRMAAAAAAALKRCGFEVMTVHYEPMAVKVARSNAWGADLHVPIHTNAFNGRVSGTRLFSYNTSGAGYRACRAIFNVLAPLTPGTSESISAYPGLYEINYANAPTAYIEVDFHDVAEVAAWLIAHTADIGEAIARGVCDYFGVTYIAPEEETPEEGGEDGGEDGSAKTVYRVILREHGREQLGSFAVKENAESFLQQLQELGIAWAEIQTAEI